MRHLVVGTAGHVDHGKTALIKALSGFDGDTLAEEKRRGITIDLSFSNLQNSDTNIAFVDVPGHESLIKNMIAGAFGFDACLLVVDASEGIMPQTSEHLEILNLLRVPQIIIALSKSDLVTPERLSKVEVEVKAHLEKFANLELGAVVPVSIYDDSSIERLRSELFALQCATRSSKGVFRYYVDRAFSLQGVGVVVTGTVLDGEVNIGDKIFVAEHNQELKVKNIQVHDQDVQIAHVSQRAALNLQNPKSKLSRGLLCTKKGYFRGFNMVDVWIESVAGMSLRHNSEMIVYIGTKQLKCKVLLYGAESMEQGYASLRFDDRIFLIFDEPFVLSSMGRIVGGGRVLNPVNEPIKKKQKLTLLKALKDHDFKSAFEILIKFHKRGFGLVSSSQRFGIGHEDAIEIAQNIDDIFVDSKSMTLYPLSVKEELERKISDIYDKNSYALLSAKSLILKITWASENLMTDILEKLCKDGKLVFKNGIYANANIQIDDTKSLIESKIYKTIQEQGIAPMAPYNIYDELDIDRKMGDDALKKLTSSKKVKRLEHNLFVSYDILTGLMTELQAIIYEEGYLDIKLFRSHYPELSRKYIVAYLDHLDSYPQIKNEGLKRVLI